MNRAVPATLIVAAVIAIPQAIQHLTGSGPRPAPAEAVVAADVSYDRSPAAPTLQPLPEFGLAIRIPDGFERHPQHPGFRDPQSGASLLIFNLPDPFADACRRFEPAAMTQRGLDFRSRENIQVDGRPAILVTAEQTVDDAVYAKLMIVVGDERRTVLLSATLPRDLADTLSLPLEQAMLGARLDRSGPDLFASLPLRIEPAEGFVIAAKDEHSVALTRDGELPTRSADRAVFVAGREVTRAAVSDRKAFAEARLAQTQGVRDVMIYAGNYASVAGLPAYELIATARLVEDDAPCFIHQVLAFDGRTIYVLQGVAHMSGGERCHGQFQAMTGSFRPQEPARSATFTTAMP
jgi:hypothetical protein